MRIMVAKKIVMDSMPMFTINATRYRGDAESVVCQHGITRRLINGIVLG